MSASKHRVCIFSLLKLTSPLHIGSGRVDDPFSDQPVIRDSRKIPFIPAGTLAGMFSSFLDAGLKEQWLGIPPRKEQDPMPSPMVFDDAYPLQKQIEALRYPVEIRNQVSIQRNGLTAKEDHHFTMEVLPVGTVFCLFCRIDLETTEQIKRFKEKMEVFLSAGGEFGGKKNAGSGRWQAREWAAKEFVLSSGNDLFGWLTKGHGFNWQGDWNGLKETLGVVPEELIPLADNKYWQMHLDVNIENGLHLSAGSSGLPIKEVPDLRQAQRAIIDEDGNLSFEYTDYGTAIKGRLRTAMEMLLRTYLNEAGMGFEDIKKKVPLDPTKKSGWDEIADLFGHTDKKGSWQVEEVPWENVDDEGREDHIRLDEFTQQAIKGAKFDFAPLRKGRSKIIVRLAGNAPDWQKELLYYAGRLLSLDILPWGSLGSRGYLGASIKFANEGSVSGSFKAGHLRQEVERQKNG